MLIKLLLVACWVHVIYPAAEEKKVISGLSMPSDISAEHMLEAAAAHRMRALVFEVLKTARKNLGEPIYYSDDEIPGFQDYPYDQEDVFRIHKGLLFCISEHNVPGIIYTRWGVWHFAQNRSSIEYDVGPLGVWEALCGNIITDERIELKPCGRATSLGGERMYIIKKVGDIVLQDPFESFDPPEVEPSRLRDIADGISKCITASCSTVGSMVSRGLKKIPGRRQRIMAEIHPYHPPNRYDSLPYTALLSDNEIYWLQLSQAYKECAQKK